MSTHEARYWEHEDLHHMDQAIDDIKANSPGHPIALPGLESVRDQIALRLGAPTRYEDWDGEDRMEAAEAFERMRMEQGWNSGSVGQDEETA